MKAKGNRTALALFCALALLLPPCVPARAGAAGEQVYRGTIGNAGVVLALNESKGDAFGSYFYQTTRLDIDLSGEVKGRAITLESRVTRDRLTLRRQGPALVGTLTTAKARHLPVRLQLAGTPPALPADLPPRASLYERWHLNGLQLTPQRTEARGGKTIRWYREPKSGIRLFRIERGYPAEAMVAVNRLLAQNQWEGVSAWFACTGYDGGPGTDTAEAQTPWLGANHVSYRWNASWSCAGAAHPDFAAIGHSYDLRTGRELKLDAVLRFGAAPIPAEESDGWYAYRSKRFAPGLVALLARHHPAEMTAPGTEQDACNYADPDVWAFPAWVLSEKGLWLGAYFARVQRVCDAPDWAVLPWSALHSTLGERP